MKLRLFILGLIVSYNSYAQSQNEKLSFEVICGAGAQTSNVIEAFKLHSSVNDSAEVKKKLLIGSDIEQVLSAILLTHYSSNGFVKLSPNEENKIEILARSKRKFSLCFTCTYHEEGTIKQLFKKNSASFEIIKQYLIGGI